MRQMPIDTMGKCPLDGGMSETQKLLSEIDGCLRSAGMADSTFGRKAVNDGKLLERLRSGGSVTLEKAAQIRRFIATQAPAEAERVA